MKFNIENWYNFKEVVKVITGNDYLPYDNNNKLELLLLNFEDIWQPYTSFFHFQGTHGYAIDIYVQDLWPVLYARFWQKTALISDKAFEDLELRDTIPFIARLLSKIDLTFQKYRELLKYYSDYKTKLMNKIENESSSNTDITNTNKRNETPQTSNLTIDDSYITEYTKNVSDTDNTTTTKIEKDTAIVRLKEIEMNYSNLLEKWSSEIECIFYEDN